MAKRNKMATGERMMMAEEIAAIYYEFGYFPGLSRELSIFKRFDEDDIYDIVQEIEEGRLDYQSLLFEVPDEIEDRLVKKYGGYSVLHRCDFRVGQMKVRVDATNFPLREVATLAIYIKGQKYTLFHRSYKDYVERSYWRISQALLKAEREGLESAKEELTKALLYAESRDATNVRLVMEALGLAKT